MLEYFPEPEQRIVIGNCKNCGDELYDGDEVVDSDGYICQDCKKAEAFQQASKADLKEFITSAGLGGDFVEWFFEVDF